MKKLPATAAGIVSLLASEIASAQSGPMMNGGMGGVGWMGGYGGYWVPVLLVVVVGLVAWIVMQRRK
jgi:ABC-type methionine transport system permease subunit